MTPSPFPGMDPFLEDPGIWQDFHATLINYLREAIADRLPENYIARVKEQIRLIDVEANEAKRFEPDVDVARTATLPGTAAAPGTAVLLEPMLVEREETAETRELSIEIVRNPEKSVVTAIEVLSPANKGKDAEEYIVTRRMLRKEPGNIVEIDLLIGGLRPPLKDRWPSGDYHVLVTRRKHRGKAQIISWSVRQPLPRIPIPLRDPDPDVEVALAEVFQITFERGRYAKQLNYSKPPPAPLSPDDLKWAAEVAAGRPNLSGGLP